MEHTEELIDYEVRRKFQILKAEGDMVDLLSQEYVGYGHIPEGYRKQAHYYASQVINNLSDGGFVWTKEEFHFFYNWLRKVGRDEPEL